MDSERLLQFMKKRVETTLVISQSDYVIKPVS